MKYTINNDFVIELPDYMAVTFDPTEIKDEKRCFVAISEQENPFYKACGQMQYSLAIPFGAPKCVTFVSPYRNEELRPLAIAKLLFGFGESVLHMSVKELAKNLLMQQWGEVLGYTSTKIICDSADITVAYGTGGENDYQVEVVTRSFAYQGQIWINDTEDQSTRDAVAEQILSSILPLEVVKDIPASIPDESNQAESKENRKKRIDEYRDAYDGWKRKMKEWEKECQRVRSKRESTVKELMEAEKRKLKENAAEKMNQTITKSSGEIEQLKKAKAEAERYISNLGAFSFSEKKKQREIIEKADRNISNNKRIIADARTGYQIRMQEIPKEVAGKKQSFIEEANSAKPLPPEPVKPKTADYLIEKGAILQCLSDENERTVVQVQKSVSELDDLSNQRVSALLRELTEEGILIRNYRGMAYYVLRSAQ